ELDKHCSRHNYTPFCLYLVASVRGLMLALTNRQFASGTTAWLSVWRLFGKSLVLILIIFSSNQLPLQLLRPSNHSAGPSNQL
ncbi:uncharacterized protein VP01_15689g1, partial [Puccinia sorghi]